MEPSDFSRSRRVSKIQAVRHSPYRFDENSSIQPLGKSLDSAISKVVRVLMCRQALEGTGRRARILQPAGAANMTRVTV